jgi:hypothetical protein
MALRMEQIELVGLVHRENEVQRVPIIWEAMVATCDRCKTKVCSGTLPWGWVEHLSFTLCGQCDYDIRKAMAREVNHPTAVKG